MPVQKLLRILLPAVLLFFPRGSVAAEKLLLTGAEVTSSSTTYLFVGTAIPFPESSLAEGFALHLWADYQTYSYEAGTTEIDADITGLTATIGYHDMGVDNWWNARLGVVHSKTGLSPDDPGNDSAGSGSNLKLQLEGEKRYSSDFKMVGNFEYIFGRSAHWMRMRFLNRNDDNTYDGPEVIYQGDDSYSAWQLGWALVEKPVGEDWKMGLKAGFRIADNDTAVYAGIELITFY